MRKYRGGISTVENSLSEMPKINDGSGTKYLRISKSGSFTGNVLNVTGTGKLWFVFSTNNSGQSPNDYVKIVADGKSYTSKSIGSSAALRPSCGYISFPFLYFDSRGRSILPSMTEFVYNDDKYFFGVGESYSTEIKGYLISSDPIVFSESLKVDIALVNNYPSNTYIMYQLT